MVIWTETRSIWWQMLRSGYVYSTPLVWKLWVDYLPPCRCLLFRTFTDFSFCCCNITVVLRVWFKYFSISRFFTFFSCGAKGRLTFWVYRSHTIRHTHTHGRTPLDEWLASRRRRYLHNKQKRRTSILSPGFEPCDPIRRAAADVWVRPHGHRDRFILSIQLVLLVMSG